MDFYRFILQSKIGLNSYFVNDIVTIPYYDHDHKIYHLHTHLELINCPEDYVNKFLEKLELKKGLKFKISYIGNYPGSEDLEPYKGMVVTANKFNIPLMECIEVITENGNILTPFAYELSFIPDVSVCTCDSKDLLWYGCRCGYKELIR